MPERITKNKKGGYTVRGPHGVHAKNTTLKKAKAQARIIMARDHGYKKPPRRK